MCFSAGASFVASGTLTAVGGATLYKNKKKKEYPLAIIPLLFAIQQFAEGMVWITFNKVAIYTFLIFALVIWPTYVPAAVLKMESEKDRHRYLKTLLFLGAVISISLIWQMISQPVNAEIIENHIVYYFNKPWELTDWMAIWLYALVVIASPLLSSSRFIRLGGFALMISFLTTFFFFQKALVSVWCFFAAILSLAIFYHFKLSKK